MSKAAEFYAKVMTSESLRSQLEQILQGKTITEATDADLEKIGELAKQTGFSIPLEEAKAYIRMEEIAVSDEALDAVAGGKKKIRCEGKNTGAYYDKTNDKWYDR